MGITSPSVNRKTRDYVLRVAQDYRREDGEWQDVYRHVESALETAGGP